MSETHVSSSSQQRWMLDDIPWTRIDPAVVAAEEELLFFVATASFVEAATDLYVRNLLHRFSGEEDVGVWLDKHWQHEEMQHGRALRRYCPSSDYLRQMAA